jgi:hypothetical protein
MSTGSASRLLTSSAALHRITRENLRLWRINGVRRLPERANLAAVARIIGQPYRQILSAALFDTGYLTRDRQLALISFNLSHAGSIRTVATSAPAMAATGALIARW